MGADTGASHGDVTRTHREATSAVAARLQWYTRECTTAVNIQRTRVHDALVGRCTPDAVERSREKFLDVGGLKDQTGIYFTVPSTTDI